MASTTATCEPLHVDVDRLIRSRGEPSSAHSTTYMLSSVLRETVLKMDTTGPAGVN
jgi:hypothetical protein